MPEHSVEPGSQPPASLPLELPTPELPELLALPLLIEPELLVPPVDELELPPFDEPEADELELVPYSAPEELPLLEEVVAAPVPLEELVLPLLPLDDWTPDEPLLIDEPLLPFDEALPEELELLPYPEPDEPEPLPPEELPALL